MVIYYKDYKKLKILDHPLLKHKITMLRDARTITSEFRSLVSEIAAMEGFEAFRGLETHEIKISTPLEETMQPVVDGSKICFVPILRAGLGMVDGMVQLVPNAKVGHLGMYRDEVTHEPVEYFCKLPKDIADLDIYILDPMLATAGSAIDAVKTLKKYGATKINFICIIAAPEGVKKFCETYPDIPLYVGAVDRCLNESAYICPGLGDCGDRIFGTEPKTRHTIKKLED